MNKIRTGPIFRLGLRLLLPALALALDPVRAEPADEALAMWRDPVFQKQFMGSYGMRAEIEPRVTQPEKEFMEELMPLLGNADDLPRAAEMLKKTIKPASSAVLDFTLANVLFQLDRRDEAAEWHRRAIEKFPSFQRAHRNLALIHAHEGAFEKAIAPLTRAIELGAQDGLTFGLLAHAYAMSDRQVAAESAYRMAMLLQPASIDWLTGLARALFRQRKYAEAYALCDELIRRDPENTDYWLLQANAGLGLKQPMRAAEIYEFLDLSGRAPPRALHTLGDIYVNEGYPDLAADAYLRALSRDAQPTFDKHIRNAEVLSARGANADAMRLVAAIRQTFGPGMALGENKRVLKLEARMAAASGAAAERQLRLLEEIVALDPLDGEALILLGQHHARTGDIAKASLFFERAAAIEEFEAEARLRHGQHLVRNARYQEALPLLKRSQELKPREDLRRYLEQVERIGRMRP